MIAMTCEINGKTTGKMAGMVPRYALYFAPAPESALWRFGCTVLGYDAATGQDVAPAVPPDKTLVEWATATEAPRRYGFHGTLVAPMHLRAGATEDAYLEAIRQFAGQQAPRSAPGLKVQALGSFLALTIAGDAAPVAELAADATRALSPWRAPLTDADRARRLASPLTPRQKQHLADYGYPYVLEDFRFHMTLTGSLPEPQRADFATRLAADFAARVPPNPLAVDAVSIFRQDRRDGRFRIIARIALAVRPSSHAEP